MQLPGGHSGPGLDSRYQLPSSFRREMTPSLLAPAALPTGHRPDLTRPFWYDDLGYSNQAR